MKRKTDLLFLGLLLAVSLLYGYHYILFSRPSYHHIWRQADCLSITMNYCEDNRNFFRPAIHWVGNAEGRTISEFPLIYFTVGQLWKVFGPQEFIFRLINLLIVFAGLFSLFRFARDFLGDFFWAAAIPLLLFSSPVLGYFANNFLADAPALGLTLVACYLYWRAYTRHSSRTYLWAFAVFLLAALLKVSALLIFIALLTIHLYMVIFRRNDRSWYNRPSRLWPYFVVLLLVFAWYTYAGYYNKHNMSGIFLHGLLPIWGIDANQRLEIWKILLKTIIPSFFSNEGLLVLLGMMLTSLILYRKANKFFLALTLLVFFGGIGFMLLFYQVFNVHDYYMINLLIFIPLPVITLLDLLHRHYPAVFSNVVVKAVFGLGVMVLLYMGAVNTRMKYRPEETFVQESVLVSRQKINDWISWSGWCGTYYKSLETIRPYLRSIGLKRDDLVYSTPDGTINVTLYLMDQKGFSDFYIKDIPENERIEKAKSFGVRYLVINDTAICKQAFLAPYLTHKIGSYQNVVIYDLKP